MNPNLEIRYRSDPGAGSVAEEAAGVQESERAAEQDPDGDGHGDARSAEQLTLVPHQRPVPADRHG